MKYYFQVDDAHKALKAILKEIDERDQKYILSDEWGTDEHRRHLLLQIDAGAFQNTKNLPSVVADPCKYLENIFLLYNYTLISLIFKKCYFFKWR